MRALISMKKIIHRLKANSGQAPARLASSHQYSLVWGQAPRLNSGQAAITAVIFFVSLLLAITFGFSFLAVKQTQILRTEVSGKQSFYVAEAGQEDVVYRLLHGMSVNTVESLTLNGHTATTTQTIVLGNTIVVTEGNVTNHIRTIETELTPSGGVAFSYGMQAGEGGVFMENTSSVIGNVISNGPIRGNGNTEIIKGDVISAGPSGTFDKLRATGTVYAHNIRETSASTLIEKDAYYQVIDADVSVLGTKYPGSSDQATSSFPISDAQIAAWETAAEAGGIITSPCPYKIESATTIGPVKITCDLEISNNNYDLNLGGHVWVTGNITINNSPNIRVQSSLGNRAVVMIADNPSNRLSSSKIGSDNSATFEGNGDKSFVMLLSLNESAKQGGGEVAINVANSASGDLLVYAPSGEILIQNSISLKEVTAYEVHTKNSAQVVYESGLANSLFTGGPQGGYEIVGWKEVE